MPIEDPKSLTDFSPLELPEIDAKPTILGKSDVILTDYKGIPRRMDSDAMVAESIENNGLPDGVTFNGDINITADFAGLLGTKITNTNGDAVAVAGAVHQMTNDLGYWALIGLTSSASTILSGIFQNAFNIYTQGYANMLFTMDGNNDFVWYTDPTDSHNFSALSNEVMRLKADGTLVVGGAGANRMETDTNGTIRTFGDGRTWKDLLGSLQGQNLDTSSGRIDYNYFNGAVGYQNNSRYPNEPVVVRHQINHDFYFGTGAVARPHLHWKQQHATNIPNWLFGWKIVRNGEIDTIETDWSNYTFSTIQSNTFTYTSGVLDQISTFTEIDISSLDVSDILITVLWRDTGNVSGEFAGSDPSSLVELATDLDCHLLVDSLGSDTEYVK